MRGHGALRLCPPYGLRPHHVVFDFEPPTRSITLPLSLSLSASRVIDQNSVFLDRLDQNNACRFRAAFAEKLSSALPDAPLMEDVADGKPVEIGLPRIFLLQ